MLAFEIQVPIADIMRAADAIREAERAGLLRVETAIQQIAVRKAGQIRLRRVPTKREVAEYEQRRRVTKTGRRRALQAGYGPAWRPTGELLRSVQAAPMWDGPTAVELHADVPYATARHELGVTRMPKAPALGVIRRDPFFADAVTIVQPQANELFADGFNSTWEDD